MNRFHYTLAGAALLGSSTDDDDDRDMLRMSLLEHLDELRDRILKAVAGLGVAYLACLVFANQIWAVIQQPAKAALLELGINPPKLVTIEATEAFSTIWVKVPLVVAMFIASPWVLWQVWAFISPGFYERERKMAIPFVLASGALFVLGGLFAYFVVFRYGLTFLLQIGRDADVAVLVTMSDYFDRFMNVVLGVALVFELPVVIFLLTLLRVASPEFLLRHAEYAILAITILAAFITPTQDFLNMALFAVPMSLLFFLGVFASYLLVLKREKRRFPWSALWKWLLAVTIVAAGFGGILMSFYHLHVIPHWPFVGN